MSRAGRPWAPGDDAVLIKKYRNSCVAKLAAEMGRTERALGNRAHRLNIKPKKSNNPRTIGIVFESVAVPELNWSRL